MKENRKPAMHDCVRQAFFVQMAFDQERLCQDIGNNTAMHVGQFAVEPVVIEGKAIKVEPEKFQHGAVELPNVGHSLYGTTAKLVGGTVTSPSLHAGPHHPAGEGIGVMISACCVGLVRWHPAKLGGPQDERVF